MIVFEQFVEPVPEVRVAARALALDGGHDLSLHDRAASASSKDWECAKYPLTRIATQFDLSPQAGRSDPPIQIAVRRPDVAFSMAHLPQRRETIAVPPMPSTRAAPVDRSMHRPFTNGPRSFIRTVTLRPVEWEVTVT